MYLQFHCIRWRFNVCTNNIHYTCIHHRCEWMYATYLLIWCPSFYTIINLRSVIMSNLDYATWLQNSNEGGDFIVFYFLREPPALLPTLQCSPAARPAPHSGSKWLKPTENNFSCCDFTSFYKQVSANSHSFRFRSFPALQIQKMLKPLIVRLFSF